MSMRTIFYLNMICELRAKLNVSSEPFCFEWWICCYFQCCFENVHIVLKLPWLGFDQGFGRRWTPHELIKVIEQTSNGPWTNEIRLYVIFCYLRLVKTRKSKILIQPDCLDYLWYVKRPNVFTWLSFTEGYRGTSFRRSGIAFSLNVLQKVQ